MGRVIAGASAGGAVALPGAHEHGANPVSLPDAVGQALAHAEAQRDHRPARDTADLVQELRRLLNSQGD